MNEQRSSYQNQSKNEQIRPVCQNQSKNEQEANGAALAYNKNYNILYSSAPTSTATSTEPMTTSSGASNAIKEGFDRLMGTLGDTNKEYETETKARGEANITNVNLNFIITMSNMMSND